MWNRSENQIKLVMIRHGATISNREHRYLGKMDETLSAEGKESLQDARNNYPKVDYIFSSPMKRCLETAHILYPNKEIITIAEWEEMDFGDFEGKNHIELQENVEYQKWIDSNGTLPFPNGENQEKFVERCKNGFEKMRQELIKLPQLNTIMTIGLILHGGTIMALLSFFYGGQYFDYQVANGQGYICTWKVCQKNSKITEIQKIGEGQMVR